MRGILLRCDLRDLPRDIAEYLSSAAMGRPGREWAANAMDRDGIERLAETMEGQGDRSTGVIAARPQFPAPHVWGRHGSRMQGQDDDDDGKGTTGPGTNVVTRQKPKTKRPSLYRVLLLNDDYTPMEFVVHVLERFFGKSREVATQIMLHVHHHGVGECGIFTYEVAETKVTQVMDFARKHQHPLQCVMEKN
jgi:ATP-dependent Clp protease adaptor protein ClpS